MNFLKENFQFLVVVILIIILFGERVFKPVPPPIVTKDTVWQVISSPAPIQSQPIIIHSTPPQKEIVTQPVYLPDTSYKGLLEQYKDVLLQLLTEKVTVDSLKIDSIGYVRVQDTVQNNMITGRSYTYSLNYPTITNTVYPSPVNQIYVGGGLNGNQIKPLKSVEGSILWKNKKDQLYQFRAGTDFNEPYFGVSSFWKIKFR